MANEENSKDFFPNTDFRTGGGDWNESMKGQGYERTQIERFGYPGREDFQIRHFGVFMIDKVNQGVDGGNLGPMFAHYVNQFEKADIFDSRTLSNLKTLAKSAEDARTRKQQREIADQIIEYIGQMKMARR